VPNLSITHPKLFSFSLDVSLLLRNYPLASQMAQQANPFNLAPTFCIRQDDRHAFFLFFILSHHAQGPHGK
jgi:hypothetical protein